MSESRIVTSLVTALMVIPAPLLAQATERIQDAARGTGVSGIWILANLAYAGMRAQSHPSVLWRFLSFLAGFPGTLLTTIFVREGSERAYGVDIPRNPRAVDAEPAHLRFVRRDQ